MDIVTIILLAVVVDAMIGLWIGNRRESPVLGVWLGAIFGPIGWVIMWNWPAESDELVSDA